MAINFKEIAQKELTLSPLMAGKTQIKTEDLIGQEATIMEFDFATITDKGEEKTYPVMLLKEYPERYYNGGALLLKLAIAWASACDGDVEAASQELKNSGGVKVRFRATRTKGGNNLTSVDVL
nr:MAG TPA: hypothetical protein [Caudoviricetes sp.]